MGGLGVLGGGASRRGEQQLKTEHRTSLTSATICQRLLMLTLKVFSMMHLLFRNFSLWLTQTHMGLMGDFVFLRGFLWSSVRNVWISFPKNALISPSVWRNSHEHLQCRRPCFKIFATASSQQKITFYDAIFKLNTGQVFMKLSLHILSLLTQSTSATSIQL